MRTDDVYYVVCTLYHWLDRESNILATSPDETGWNAGSVRGCVQARALWVAVRSRVPLMVGETEFASSAVLRVLRTDPGDGTRLGIGTVFHAWGQSPLSSSS